MIRVLPHEKDASLPQGQGLRIGRMELATRLLLSPIAGYCDLPFRLTIRPLGGLALASTDLVNPRGLMRRTWKSMQLVETDPDDQPLCIQLYGPHADELAEAARWCQDHGACIIDINMGCPVDKVCKKDAGSALLRDPAGAARLAERVVRAVDVPVTVKMRLGWDETSIVAPALAADLERAGVAAITVHGRTAAQKFSGSVCLDGIARVVEAVRSIPVIGNGDIRRPEDTKAMMDRTGCAGVMIGREALRDPWIFRDTHAFLTTGRVPPAPTVEERLTLMTRHFEHLLRIRGERLACITMRQRVSWYATRLPPCKRFKERMRMLSSSAEFYVNMHTLAMELLGRDGRRHAEEGQGTQRRGGQ
ncbi:MAG TPA: tRNA dihydrouridine synthase DusB [Phycisphaerae bacterium]|jgi:tRNA-dihydrouridine synthase B|nr:tRNA dihydrouridine synthase DusB [Phycisphaerae bacterium]HOJ53620.1 tRNA dihydrouridine synthase DusB [Phycisphaerae bacterium]HOL26345.1 tRNA dihydrouridine synthase DusB [Phycisphaerae bacterium]HPP21146.1 tRNA dihydrouridine synthase DusB [Phycisphaerae bacterium]HPU33218.1 tRNA dihydrouridine synthase DusB [Phycisphaerae bacterium]